MKSNALKLSVYFMSGMQEAQTIKFQLLAKEAWLWATMSRKECQHRHYTTDHFGEISTLAGTICS